MKKANIILSAIGLLSVIGGALAFKAQHRFTNTLACYTTGSTHKFLGKNYTTIGIDPATSAFYLCTVPGPRSYVLTQVTIGL
jgi:hypothetical protein